MSSHTYPVAQKTNRLTLVVPQIKKQYFDQGVRYYETVDGRIWDANIFDEKCVPQKGKVLPKHTNSHDGGGGRSRLVNMQVGLDFEKKRTKVCNKCNEEKSLNLFYKTPNSKDGRRNDCISCTKDSEKFRAALYRQNNMI